MKYQKLYGSLYLIIGIGILLLWAMLLSTNQVPELHTAKTEIIIHIVVEVVMGLFSIITGYLMLRNSSYFKSIMLITNGFLGYSVINSSGYYLEQLNIPMVIMFWVILLYVIVTSYKVIKMKS